MARSRRRGGLIEDRPTFLRADAYAAHPLAMQPVIIGVRTRRRSLRRGLIEAKPTLIKRPGRARVIRARTVPRLALRLRRGARSVALFRDGDNSPLKQRRLCKCHSARSSAQRRVSRKFFANGGGSGRKAQSHHCTC